MRSDRNPKGPMNLSSVINPWSAPFEKDVKKVKDALHGTGHYQLPEAGFGGFKEPRLLDAVKSFQGDKGLRVDGHIAPGGPTENAIANSMIYRCVICGRPHGGVYNPKICWECYTKP